MCSSDLDDSPKSLSLFAGSEDSNSILCSQNPTSLRGRKLTSFGSSNKTVSPIADPEKNKPTNFCSVNENANDGSMLAEFQNDTDKSPKEGAGFKLKAANEDAASFKSPSPQGASFKSANQEGASFKSTNQEGASFLSPLGAGSVAETVSPSESPSVFKSILSSTPHRRVEIHSQPRSAITRKRKRHPTDIDIQDEDTSTQEIKIGWAADNVSATVLTCV